VSGLSVSTYREAPNVFSFCRDGVACLPSIASPVYSNEHIAISRRNSSECSQYSNTDVVRRRSGPRPSSLYSNSEMQYINTRTPLYNNEPENAEPVSTDVNENQVLFIDISLLFLKLLLLHFREFLHYSIGVVFKLT